MSTFVTTDSSRWLDRRVLVALLLAGLTWLAGQPGAQVVSAGKPYDLTENTWTAARSASVVNNGTQDIVVRNDGDRRASVRTEIALEPAASERLRRVSLNVERLSSSDGAFASPAPRVILGWLQGDKHLGWASTLRVSSWAKTTTLDAMLTVPDDADGLHIGLMVPDIGSEWRFSSMLLRPVIAASWAGATRIALALSWLLLAAWFLLPALRRLPLLQVGLACAGLAVVVLGTGFSRHSLAVVSHPVVFVLTEVVGVSGSDAGRFAQKGGHYMAFLLLAIVLFAIRRGLALRAVSVAGLCLAIAIGSEALQLYVVGRSTRGSDIVIDVAGIVTGILCFLLWQRLRRPDRSWPAPVDS